MAMNRKAIQTIIEKAKKDPKFFHALAFNPESILDQLTDLDKKSRGKIVGNSADAVIAAAMRLQCCGDTLTQTVVDTPAILPAVGSPVEIVAVIPYISKLGIKNSNLFAR